MLSTKMLNQIHKDYSKIITQILTSPTLPPDYQELEVPLANVLIHGTLILAGKETSFH